MQKYLREATLAISFKAPITSIKKYLTPSGLFCLTC